MGKSVRAVDRLSSPTECVASAHLNQPNAWPRRTLMILDILTRRRILNKRAMRNTFRSPLDCARLNLSCDAEPMISLASTSSGTVDMKSWSFANTGAQKRGTHCHAHGHPSDTAAHTWHKNRERKHQKHQRLTRARARAERPPPSVRTAQSRVVCAGACGLCAPRSPCSHHEEKAAEIVAADGGRVGLVTPKLLHEHSRAKSQCNVHPEERVDDSVADGERRRVLYPEPHAKGDGEHRVDYQRPNHNVEDDL